MNTGLGGLRIAKSQGMEGFTGNTSNFPIDRVSMPWSTLYDAFALSGANRSDEERQALFHGTAARVYRIEVSYAN